jgi:hypothetical protein
MKLAISHISVSIMIVSLMQSGQACPNFQISTMGDYRCCLIRFCVEFIASGTQHRNLFKY